MEQREIELILSQMKENKEDTLKAIEGVKEKVNFLKRKLFIDKDNGEGPLAEQIHLNTVHRKAAEEAKKFYHQTWFKVGLTILLTSFVSLFLFIHFGIK